MNQLTKNTYHLSIQDSTVINILRFWLIIGVVFIHSVVGKTNFATGSRVIKLPEMVIAFEFMIRNVISRSAVPAFFLISALLLYRKEFQWEINIKKKFRTLTVPYICINTIWIIIYFVAQHIPSLSVFFSNPDMIVSRWGIAQWLNAYIGFKSGDPLVYPLWFMRDLFVMNMLAVIIKNIIDKFPFMYITVIGILYFIGFDTHVFFLKISTIFFFSIGYYIVKFRFHLSDTEKINALGLWILYFIFILVATVFRDTRAFQYFQVLSTCIGILAFMQLAFKVRNVKFKAFNLFMSKYSVAVFLFHECTLTVQEKIISRLMPLTVGAQIVQFFGNVILIILICTLAGMLMKKFVPSIYGIITGNR